MGRYHETGGKGQGGGKMTTDTSPAILIEGVTRSFGRKNVLRGVSATAMRGRVIGILGRNGVGKTTLFKIILDMLSADDGQVELLGLRPDGTGAIRQLVGYVPERPSFHDFMTVKEVFTLRSRFFKKWDMDKAMSLSKQLELEPGTKIGGASKGTLGKIAWVCAASHDPELFLLDEPTSGLDALVRGDILGHLIGELHESGKTILVANHRMEELAGVLDELWVMTDGVITGSYDAETLRTQACRITGRLKEGAHVPDGIPVMFLSGDGPLTELAVFERSAAEKLAKSGVFEKMERAPLPFETAMRVLLKQKGGSHDDR